MWHLNKFLAAGLLALSLSISPTVAGLAVDSTTTTGVPGSSTTTSPSTSTTILVPRPTVIPATQTTARPSTENAVTQLLTELWNDILTNNSADARKLFIPMSAYDRIKSIPSPSYDWHVRLMAFFNLDFATYHRALTTGGVAVLSSIDVRQSYAHWIPSAYCMNRLGYWHLPGPRFVYTQNGVTKSVGVLSLISWHGVWYIVHLGPNPRSTNGGELYHLATGPGVVGPPGSC